MNLRIASIHAKWKRQGILNRATATESDLISFEQRYSVKLPLTIKDYFCELNGTIIGELGMDDDSLIGFWHLDQVRPLGEVWPEYATAEASDLFAFADYSIWAHGYAIRLAAGINVETPVFLIAGPAPLQIAPSFESFLERYAADDQDMLFGRI